ncbi:hypothetical protein I4U23_029023 [Adineta vaga]|nr:hypothetical protein I4U23_029023 [Adineta vaga]
MSDPNEDSSSNYFCYNCGTQNTNRTRCIQCQTEYVEDQSTQIHNPQPSISNENDDQQIPLINEFENLFTNEFDLQSFTNMLLPMLISQIQPNQRHHRSRRSRLPRRIKRITHSPFSHRYLPPLDILPFQVRTIPTSPLQILNINEFVPGQVLNTQFQSNIPLIQVPLQLFIFDQNRDHFNTQMLTHFFNEDNQVLSISRANIDQLPNITITPSNLTINPSCAICLENFDPSIEVKQLPICHHIFHMNCLTEWLLRHGNCPMCRTRILSNQQEHVPVINHHWMEQLLLQTFEQQPTNTIVPYSPVKTIDSTQISFNTAVIEHPSSDTPQLPRFDSSSNTE